MAEQFLEDIYRDALIIQQLKEYINLSEVRFDRDARVVYNKAAKGIEHILLQLEKTDKKLAVEIENAAIEIRESFDDSLYAASIVESKLIPLLFSYMSYFCGIEVTEGKYTISSANNGFLSIFDNELKVTIHSKYDPMWEAYQIATSIFDPEVETYHILGCGLGYLPYQLWVRSEGAVRLVIYEEDEAILNFARHYGVLSWIPENSLEIYHYTDEEKLAVKLISDVESFSGDNKKDVLYISFWKKDIYRNVLQGRISVLDANISLERSMRQRTSINLWKNHGREYLSFNSLKERLSFDEWIVVSAGPSLDEQIGFLRDSKGKCGILAVNTVLRRLCNEGIKPDLMAAADQYVQMREHIEGIGDKTAGIPLIAEWRLNWQYVDRYQGPICFISAGEKDYAPDGNGEIWQVSGSVAGVALEAAVRLGAKTVYLVGQDLAYPDGKTYAKGMPYNADANSRSTMLVASVDGGMVPTSEAFNWFRIGLENQIARYSDVKFFNLSKHGAFIKGCKNI